MERFQSVLQSYGYYAANIDIAIAGHPITDPTLPDIINQLPAEPKAEVMASFTPGEQFRLGQVSINGSVPTDAREKLDLKSGAPAVAADVLAASGPAAERNP